MRRIIALALIPLAHSLALAQLPPATAPAPRPAEPPLVIPNGTSGPWKPEPGSLRITKQGQLLDADGNEVQIINGVTADKTGLNTAIIVVHPAAAPATQPSTAPAGR